MTFSLVVSFCHNRLVLLLFVVCFSKNGYNIGVFHAKWKIFGRLSSSNQPDDMFLYRKCNVARSKIIHKSGHNDIEREWENKKIENQISPKNFFGQK